MSLKAYQDAQRVVEDSRQTEYRLFGQVTGALIDIKKTSAKGAPFIEALDWNRRVWQAMANDCMDSRNQLPSPVRAQIISLSMWVARYTRQVVRKKAPIDPLIEINRTIMQGLTGSA
jgi:flagellar biosynthesis activator protein FlaF